MTQAQAPDLEAALSCSALPGREVQCHRDASCMGVAKTAEAVARELTASREGAEQIFVGHQPLRFGEQQGFYSPELPNAGFDSG